MVTYMNCPKGAILKGTDIEGHILHNDALGDQAPSYSAHTRNIKELVNLELWQLLIKSAGL